jgi:hypothetical protein
MSRANVKFIDFLDQLPTPNVQIIFKCRLSPKQCFLSFLWWGETQSTWYVQLQRIDDDVCGAVDGIRAGRGSHTQTKPIPVPLCPPQIPHDLTQN